MKRTEKMRAYIGGALILIGTVVVFAFAGSGIESLKLPHWLSIVSHIILVVVFVWGLIWLIFGKEKGDTP